MTLSLLYSERSLYYELSTALASIWLELCVHSFLFFLSGLITTLPTCIMATSSCCVQVCHLEYDLPSFSFPLVVKEEQQFSRWSYNILLTKSIFLFVAKVVGPWNSIWIVRAWIPSRPPLTALRGRCRRRWWVSRAVLLPERTPCSQPKKRERKKTVNNQVSNLIAWRAARISGPWSYHVQHTLLHIVGLAVIVGVGMSETPRLLGSHPVARPTAPSAPFSSLLRSISPCPV